MTVRPFEITDIPTLSDWWQARHGALADFPVEMLPPLSVIVEDEEGPCFFISCYESFGVGVAFLEYPVSRPGMTPRQTRDAAAFGIAAIKELAGKRCNPPAEYVVFKAVPSESLFRAMSGMGFVKEYDCPHIPCLLNTSQ